MTNLTLKRLAGVTAAVAAGAAALIGPAAGTAGAAQGAHCDRAARDMWSEGPGTDVIAQGCSIPDDDHRWYRIRVGTLVQTYYKTEYLDGGVARTRTVHDRSVRCLGHIAEKKTVHWFGCVPS
ncbi:hypothetical protein [Streptomyces naphthomycinicus]|uniref:hypothetical protein n=1 Tax=Streptomyces naphthomycinicus TaxID=2872625 RepID=UPI001CEC810B|nr:hypothetical protein [Streptomyces sp. TML10]